MNNQKLSSSFETLNSENDNDGTKRSRSVSPDITKFEEPGMFILLDKKTLENRRGRQLRSSIRDIHPKAINLPKVGVVILHQEDPKMKFKELNGQMKLSLMSETKVKGVAGNTKSKSRAKKRKALKTHLCETCNHTFRKNYQLKVHISRVHHSEKPFKCNICGKPFASKQRKKSHVEAIHEGKKLSANRLNCDLCKKSFASKQRLNSHVASIHEGNKPIVNRLECSFCDSTFASKQRLKTHINSIHEGKKPTVEKLQCELCEKTLSSKQRLI